MSSRSSPGFSSAFLGVDLRGLAFGVAVLRLRGFLATALAVALALLAEDFGERFLKGIVDKKNPLPSKVRSEVRGGLMRRIGLRFLLRYLCFACLGFGFCFGLRSGGGFCGGG